MRHDAFDVISEESAYWIGVLMTDGCLTFRVRHGNPSGAKTISLTLTESDRHHVEAFKRFVGTDNKIHVHRSQGFPGSRPRCRIEYTSHRSFDALVSYGVTPRKSLTAKVTGLEFNRDFWRGVIDGNGTIMNTRGGGKGCVGISLVGTDALVSQFIAYAKAIVPDLSAKAAPHPSTKGICAVQVSGEPGISIVRELYEGCSVALPRKWVAAQEVIAQQGTIQTQREWPKVSVADLKQLKSEHGSWVRVARCLGLSVQSLMEMRRTLRPKQDPAQALDDREFPTNRKGERAPNAKLTDEQAREMIRRRRSGEMLKSLAREYGVSPSVASQTCNGRIRTHLVG